MPQFPGFSMWLDTMLYSLIHSYDDLAVFQRRYFVSKSLLFASNKMLTLCEFIVDAGESNNSCWACSQQMAQRYMCVSISIHKVRLPDSDICKTWAHLVQNRTCHAISVSTQESHWGFNRLWKILWAIPVDRVRSWQECQWQKVIDHSSDQTVDTGPLVSGWLSFWHRIRVAATLDNSFYEFSLRYIVCSIYYKAYDDYIMTFLSWR